MGILVFFLLFVPTTLNANEPTINATTESYKIEVNTTLIGTTLKTKNGTIINLCSQHECYELLKRELDLVGNSSKGERECKEALIKSESGYEFWKVFGIVSIILTILSCCCCYCCCYFCSYLNSHEEYRIRFFSSN